jgi:hypothetical protein
MPFPIYWLGPKPGDTYELTQTIDGKIYIRYLAAGIPVGDSHPLYVTVATYPHIDGFRTVRQARRRRHEWVRKLPNGGLAVASPALPKSVYFSYPGAHYLVEVFDPKRKGARALVTSDQVHPIR